jgi:hypothetical protein
MGLKGKTITFQKDEKKYKGKVLDKVITSEYGPTEDSTGVSVTKYLVENTKTEKIELVYPHDVVEVHPVKLKPSAGPR